MIGEIVLDTVGGSSNIYDQVKSYLMSDSGGQKVRDIKPALVISYTQDEGTLPLARASATTASSRSTTS